MNPPGKKVTILGLGLSGYESALFLSEKGFEVFVSEASESPELEKKATGLWKVGIPVEIGKHTLEKVCGCDWVLISPGIPPSAEIYQELIVRGISVFSEIEVASWFSPSKKVIAITGSAGKTTISTLLHQMLQEEWGRATLCGNMGEPWIAQISKIQPSDFIILEVSSFQLVHCYSFCPETAVLLNVSQNHLDWHRSMEDYVYAKLNLFKNQEAKQHGWIRPQDRVQYFPNFNFAAKLHFFGESKEDPNMEVLRALAAQYGCQRATIQKVLEAFKGLEHRLEKFASWKGVDFVNDSKATTTASLAWALRQYPDQSVILIAGGQPKSHDFDSIRDLMKQKVKKAVLIGKAQAVLMDAWKGSCRLECKDAFLKSIEEALNEVVTGDTVLLSPACSSFDMFRNYQDRGRQFKEIVKKLIAT